MYDQTVKGGKKCFTLLQIKGMGQDRQNTNFCVHHAFWPHLYMNGHVLLCFCSCAQLQQIQVYWSRGKIQRSDWTRQDPVASTTSVYAKIPDPFPLDRVWPARLGWTTIINARCACAREIIIVLTLCMCVCACLYMSHICCLQIELIYITVDLPACFLSVLFCSFQST